MRKREKSKAHKPASAQERKDSFEEIAARLREMTVGRIHTPSEVLVREGRDER